MTNKKQHAGAPIKALLGRKLGMTQVWDADGHLVPLTVVQVGTNVVTQVRTEEVDGYSAIQLGFGEIDSRKVTKPCRATSRRLGLPPAVTSLRSARPSKTLTSSVRNSTPPPSRLASPSTFPAPPRARALPAL